MNMHARVVWKTPVVDTLVRSLDRILPILFLFALGGKALSLILFRAPFSPMSESRSWHQHLLAIRFPYPSLELC